MNTERKIETVHSYPEILNLEEMKIGDTATVELCMFPAGTMKLLVTKLPNERVSLVWEKLVLRGK